MLNPTVAILIFMTYYYTTTTAFAMSSTKVSFIRHCCCITRYQQQQETRLVSMSTLSSSVSSSLSSLSTLSSSLIPSLRRRSRIRMVHDNKNDCSLHRNMVCLSGASSSSTNMDLYRKRQHRINQKQQQQESNDDQQQQSEQSTIGKFKIPGMSDKRNHTSSIDDTSTNNNTTTSSSYHRGVHVVYNSKPPIDPNTLLTKSSNNDNDDSSSSYLLDCTNQLYNWMKTLNHSNIIALTGAGISTESGIPDYRGSNGSYYKGHQPMTHDQFIKSEHHRKRYWGRSMIGWRFVDQLQPNSGHLALATLEKKGIIGVELDDNIDYYNEEVGIHQQTDTDDNKQRRRRLSLITQNVDSFHRKAGMKDFIELHGRNDQVVCMNCGHIHNRHEFQSDLDNINYDWYQNVLLLQQQLQEESSSLRPDGDASLHPDINYDEMIIPSCKQCHVGFYKPNVVFFGDRVPSGRSLLCNNAILNSYNNNHLSSSSSSLLSTKQNADKGCNGILVMGTSLAVHSAYKYIRLASQNNIPICIINVGETRAEIEQLIGITKIEAPIGPLLSSLITTYYNN